MSLNRKAGHIEHALTQLDHASAHVLIIDSDVAVDEALIEALASALDEGADIVTAEPKLTGARTLGEHALAGVWNAGHHNFAALFAMSAGAKTLCGKAIGLSPRARGWLRSDVIGEDLELAKMAHLQGAVVAFAAVPALVPASGEATLGEVFARLTRWMCVLRAHRPALLPAVPLLFCPLLPLLFIAPLSALGIFALARTLLGARLDGWRGALRWPLGEAILLFAFVRSLFVQTVAWRGRLIRVQT